MINYLSLSKVITCQSLFNTRPVHPLSTIPVIYVSLQGVRDVLDT